MRLLMMEEHRDSCRMQQVCCPHGCGAMRPRKLMTDHVAKCARPCAPCPNGRESPRRPILE